MPVDKRPKNGLDLAVMMLLDLLAERRAMREIIHAVAEMHVEGEIFDQPFYALMNDEHLRDEDWHQQLIARAKALIVAEEKV